METGHKKTRTDAVFRPDGIFAVKYANGIKRIFLLEADCRTEPIGAITSSEKATSTIPSHITPSSQTATPAKDISVMRGWGCSTSSAIPAPCKAPWKCMRNCSGTEVRSCYIRAGMRSAIFPPAATPLPATVEQSREPALLHFDGLIHRANCPPRTLAYRYALAHGRLGRAADELVHRVATTHPP